MVLLEEILSISDLERDAAICMDKMTREYYNEAANEKITLADNISAWNRYRIRPRVFRDVSKLDTSTEIWGRKIRFPLAIAPAAMQRLAHPDGEGATSKAAAKMNIPMGLSSFSTVSLNTVIAESTGNPYALQLYVFENRTITEDLMQRASAAGYKAVILTVDTPMLGRRYNEVRNKFKLPAHMRLENYDESSGVKTYGDNITDDLEKQAGNSMGHTEAQKAGHETDSGKEQDIRHSHKPEGSKNDPSLNWDRDLTWLRQNACGMEVWVKGILTAEDAELALNHHVDGIIISNHGGRQLDSATSTLDALPEILAVINGRIPVHIDGGIRKGTDIFKAIALGADCVHIGRIPLWGLAVGGAAGVSHALKLLHDEFVLAMGLSGARSIQELKGNKTFLSKVGADGFLTRL